MNFAATGQLRLSETGERIGPLTTAAALDAMKIRAAGTLHLRPDGSVFSVRTLVEGRAAFLAAAFAPERLASIELVLLDGPGAGGMAQQDELKAEHERWLSTMGVELTPVPLVLDGQSLLPAAIGPDHPRRASTRWGEVASLIDPRNGGASVIIRYSV